MNEREIIYMLVLMIENYKMRKFNDWWLCCNLDEFLMN